MTCWVLVLLRILSVLSLVWTSEDAPAPECKKLAKGELFPWIIELELKSAGKNRTFSGGLISLRSLITCCVCIEPMNPKVKSMHRIISADLETISAKTVDRSDRKTFQVRYALQTIAEATCTTENERERQKNPLRTGVTLIAVIILDMAFFWERKFHFPRMPYLSLQDSMTDAIRNIMNNSESYCWCQSQQYVPLTKDFSSRRVYTRIHVKELFFEKHSNRTDKMSTVITGTVKSRSNGTMNLGSPLICNGTVLGVFTANRFLEGDMEQMLFIRLDFAFAFMSEFLLLERYFNEQNTSPQVLNLSSCQLPGALTSFVYFNLLNIHLKLLAFWYE